jgi:hypothetical protein
MDISQQLNDECGCTQGALQQWLCQFILTNKFSGLKKNANGDGLLGCCLSKQSVARRRQDSVRLYKLLIFIAMLCCLSATTTICCK